MSASSRPTRQPSAARPSARFAARVDLPTPPLPEATAMMWRIPGISRCARAACARGPGCGGRCAAALPCSRSDVSVTIAEEMPRLVILLVVVGCTVLAPFASPRAQTTAPQGLPREIRIASEGARPPYNYIDNGELAGFEIDLGRELCGRMKMTCTFVAQDWD